MLNGFIIELIYSLINDLMRRLKIKQLEYQIENKWKHNFYRVADEHYK